MNDEATTLTGGCGCGTVRWELSASPLGAAYCHCKRCQRRTGTGVSLSALIVPGSLTVTSGEESIDAWRPEEGWHKHFCSQCGSQLYAQDPENLETVGMRMGGFDEDPGVQIVFHQFTASAPAWAPPADDGLPRFEERAPIRRPEDR